MYKEKNKKFPWSILWASAFISNSAHFGQYFEPNSITGWAQLPGLLFSWWICFWGLVIYDEFRS